MSSVLFGHYHLGVLAEHLGGVGRQGVDVLEVSERYLLTGSAHLVHRGMQMSVCTAEAHDEQFGILLVALYHEVGYGDGVYLLLAQTSHQVVVLGVGRDGTCLVVLLQASEDMLESLATRYSPVAHAVLLLALVGSPCATEFLGYVRRIDGGILGQVGQAESARTVGDESIGEQYHRSHVFQSNLRSHIGSIEAVGGRGSGNHRHG